MIEATMAFMAERAKFTSKSSNVNAVAKFYTTLDDAQILLVANNCNNYFYNDYNNAGVFGAKSLTNNNYETYIGAIKNKSINKIATFTNNNISLNTQTTITGNILPTSNISYDLGSSNLKWRDLYLSGDTIYLGNTLISTDPDTGTLLVTDKNNKTIDIDNLSSSITTTSNSLITYFNANIGTGSQWTTNTGYISYDNIQVYNDEIRINNPTGAFIPSWVWYQFKSGLLSVDSSGNDRHLTGNGSYALDSGRNSILLVDANNATIPNENWSSFDNLSISGWFKTNNLQNGNKLLEFSLTSETSKYPRQAITNYTFAYTDGSGVTVRVIASSEASATDHSAHRLFNEIFYKDDPTSSKRGWAAVLNSYSSGTAVNQARFFNSDTTYYGEWVMVDLGESILLSKYRIYPISASIPGDLYRAPYDFRIYATNDNASWNNTKSGNWVQVDARSNIVYTADNFNEFSTNIENYYRYYAILIHKINPLGSQTTQFTEWELYDNSQNVLNNISISKQNDNLSFQINNTPLYSTPSFTNNTWTHILWNIQNSSNTPFVRLSTTSLGTEQTYSYIPISSGTYINNLGNISNIGNVNVSDFRIFTTPLTATIKNELYSPSPVYTTLVDDAYIQSTSNILQTQITSTSNTLANYVTITSNILANNIVSTSNAISSRATTLDTRVTSLDTNMSNYLKTTSNVLANRLLSTSNFLSNIITNLTADQIADGTTKKFIINNTYNTDLTVVGKLTASNLDIIGQTTTIKTATYQTENLEIVTQATDGPAFKIVQSGSQNLVDMLDTTSNVFTIRKGGNVGIANANPTEKLDIIGNIKFTGIINNVTSNQLAYVSGVTSSIQTQINNTNTYTSNYILNTSNELVKTLISTSNTIALLENRVTILDSNMSNYISTKAFAGNASDIVVSSQWKYENCNIYYNEGYVGIGNTFATETLDVTGNIKFSGSINGISYVELRQLRGISSNIETQLQDINSYINITCNILDDKINNLSILNDAELRWSANPGYVYYSNVQVHPTEIRVYNPNTTILNTYVYYVFENQNLLLVDSSPNARSLLDTGTFNAQYAYDNGKNSISLQTNSSVKIPSNNWNSFSDLTISGWFKTYSSRNGDKFINFDNSIEPVYQKFPIQNLTGFTHVYTDGTGRTLRVAESSRWSSEFGWYLFSTIGFWTTAFGSYSGGISTQTSRYFANDSSFYGEWVMVDLGEYIFFDNYIIYPNSDLYRAPTDFRIYATNDINAWNNNRSTSWVQIDERLNITSWVNGSFIVFTPTILNTQLAYRYFAIVINRKNNTTDTHVRFNRWEIYGRNIPKYNNIKLLNNNSNLSFQINNVAIYETPIINEMWNYILWNVSSSSNQEYIKINNTSNIYYNSSLNIVKYPREAITYDSSSFVYQDATIVSVSGSTRLNFTSNSWYNAFNSNINDEGWITTTTFNGLSWTKWNNGYYIFSGAVNSIGIHTNLNSVWAISEDNFSIEYNGLFYTQSYSGIFTFTLSSDDGSQLWLTIDNIETSIVGLGGVSRSSTINLNANTYYPIKIQYGDITGGNFLTVSFTPPGQASRTDGTGFYFVNHRIDYPGNYIQIDLGESTVINNYVIYANSNNLNRAPKDFRLYGSTNSAAYTNINHSSWALLDDETTQSTYYQNSVTFNNLNAYRYYSLITKSTFDNTINSNIVQIAELEFYGYPSLSYTNKLGDTSNIGSINIADFKILTTQLTSNIETELYNPTPTYIKLADEKYVQNAFSNIAESKWLTSVNDVYYTSGNVGIGGPSYGFKLNVNGTLNVNDMTTINSDIYAANIFMNSNIVSTHWTQINNNVYYNLIGNVGIGTSTVLSKLHIAETIGTVASANAGSIIIDHANNTGASSITFRSAVARGSDYAYIQYQDASTVGGAGESAKLLIGTQNDADDDIIILPSGNVGIGTTLIQSKLTINPYVINANSFNHSEAPLTVTNQTATSATVLNDPKSVLHLCRQGTSAVSFGNKASFKLCRWENLATHSRTQMDITLANESYNDVNIMSVRSDGRVGIGTTVPMANLDVNGSIIATSISASNIYGSINANYINSGIIPISYGGTGIAQFNSRSLLVADTLSIYQPTKLVWDYTTNSLGIGTNQPKGVLDIQGYANTSNNFTIIPSITITSNLVTGMNIQKQITTYSNEYFNPIVWYQFNENPLTSNVLLDYNSTSNKYDLKVDTNYNDQFITSYNLPLWYKFNDDATNMLLDSSGKNLNALNSGGAIFDSNSFITGNGSVYLNGVSQYLDISSNFNPYTIQIVNGITFSLWFKMSTTSGSSARIFDIANGDANANATNRIAIYRNTTNNTIIFDTGGRTYTTTINIVDNIWHHIVWTISSTGVWSVYIDNMYYFPNATQVIPNGTWTRRYIGRAAAATATWYVGNIDDYRVFNRALTVTEVAALYNVNNYINNPVLWYKFDANTNNMLLDSSGNYLSAYNSGNATFDDDSNNYKTGDGSIYFNGNNQYIDINSNINISTLSGANGITFASWFKVPITSATGATFFAFGDGGIGANPTNYVSIARNSTNSNLLFNINGTMFTSAVSSNYIDNNYHHFSWSISIHGEWVIYLDNEYVYPSFNLTTIRKIPVATWTKRYIGRAPGATNAYLTGNIDDFRIYNRVLTSAEVADIYNKTSVNVFKRVSEEYPPIALNSLVGTTTNVSQTISRNLYGNGTYNISVSSGTGVITAFNKLIAFGNDSCWLSSASYNTTTGNYSGSVSTIYNNTSNYLGEWMQIQLPSTIVISSYLLVGQVNSGIPTISQRGPKNFILLGSTDGANWYLLDIEIDITNWGYTGIPKIFTVTNNTIAYSYYRLCINKNQGGVSYGSITAITEWELFGNQPSTLNTLTRTTGYTINTGASDSYQYQNAFAWNHDTALPYDNIYLSHNDTVRIQSMLNLFHANEAFTIHFIFKTSNTSQTSQILYIGNTLLGDLIRIYIYDRNLYFTIGNTQCNASILANIYYVVDLIFTSLSISIYLNGIKTSSTSALYSNQFYDVDTSGLVYYIGRYTDHDVNDATPISLQDFRIFAYALSESAISSLQTGNTQYLHFASSKTENFGIERWISSTGYYSDSDKYISYTDGNVGIGTSNPSEKLDIIGNIQFTGSINGITSNQLYNMSQLQNNNQTLTLDEILDGSSNTFIVNNTYENNLIIAGNLTPTLDISYDLGSSNNRWRDLYLSGDTIYLGNTLISTDPDTGTLLVTDKNNKTIDIDNLSSSITTTSNSLITYFNANIGTGSQWTTNTGYISYSNIQVYENEIRINNLQNNQTSNYIYYEFKSQALLTVDSSGNNKTFTTSGTYQFNDSRNSLFLAPSIIATMPVENWSNFNNLSISGWFQTNAFQMNDTILEFKGSDSLFIKYPKQAMTADTFTYTDGSGTIVRSKASSIFSSPAYSVFDQLYYTAGEWQPAGGMYDSSGVATAVASYLDNDTTYRGEWVMVDLGESIVLKKYRIYPLNSPWLNRCPKDFKIYATNDNNSWTTPTTVTTWDLLDTRTNIAAFTDNLFKEFFTSTNSVSYRYYAIIINKTQGANTVQFTEWELYKEVISDKSISITNNNNNLTFIVNGNTLYQTTFNLNNNWTHIVWNILNKSSTLGFVKINGIKQTFLQPSLLSFQYSNIIGSTTNSGNLYVSDLRIITTPITTTIENALYSSYTKLVDDSYIQNTIPWKNTNNSIYCFENVGIGTNNPSEKLDIIGNIKFTGLINNVTSTQLDFVNGVTSSIQTQINNTNTYTSNYVTISSNLLANSLLNTSNTLSSQTKTLDSSIVALNTNLTNTSNWVAYLRDNKLDKSGLAINRVLTTDATGNVITSTTIDTTELGHLDGTVTNINTNFTNTSNWVASLRDNKEPNITVLQVAKGGTGKSLVTASRLIGCITANQYDEIQLGTNLSFTGSTLNATSGGGADTRWTTMNTNDIQLTDQLGHMAIGTTTAPSDITILPQVVQRGTYNHGSSPLTITHQTVTSTSILNDPQPIVNLCRQGTASQANGARATLSLSRYENAGTTNIGSRTRLDLDLAHDNYNDIKVLTVRSDGSVGIGTTVAISTLTILSQVNDRDTYNHGLAPLTITNQTATSSTILNDPQPVINLCRQGTTGQAYGVRATLSLCRYENVSTNSRTRLDFDLANGNYDSLRVMSVRSDGRVGIGKTNPAELLEVVGNVLANQFILPTTASSALYWGTGTSALGRASAAGAYSTSAVIGDIILRSDTNLHLQSGSTTSAIAIDTTNNVTIRNLLTANGKIYANGGAAVPSLGLNGGTGTCLVLYQGTASVHPYALGIDSSTLWYSVPTGASHKWYVNGANTMILNSSGNVGIGTTNPSSILHIKKTNNNNYIKIDAGSSASYYGGISFCEDGIWYGHTIRYDAATDNLLFSTQDNTPTFTDRMYLTATGNFGVGVSPSVKLHVSGDIAATGNITAYYSDERLKTITSNIENPLELINKLKGFYYKPNELAHQNGIEHSNQEIGLSAQDVQKILPELVNIAPFDLDRDKNGNLISKSGENYLTISYERLAPVFVESIKELHSMTQKQNKEILDMKTQIKKMESLLLELTEFNKQNIKK